MFDSDSNEEASMPMLSSSAVSTSGSTLSLKKYNWIHIQTLASNFELEAFIREGKYRTIVTHNVKRACNIDKDIHNIDGHKMNLITYKCSSTFCIREDDDKCPFQYQVRYCHSENINYVYQIEGVNHSNKYADSHVQKPIYGIHKLYENEIVRLLEENSLLKPTQILKILTKNKKDGKYQLDVTLPTITQIQTKKFNYIRKRSENRASEEEFEQQNDEIINLNLQFSDSLVKDATTQTELTSDDIANLLKNDAKAKALKLLEEANLAVKRAEEFGCSFEDTNLITSLLRTRENSNRQDLFNKRVKVEAIDCEENEFEEIEVVTKKKRTLK